MKPEQDVSIYDLYNYLCKARFCADVIEHPMNSELNTLLERLESELTSELIKQRAEENVV